MVENTKTKTTVHNLLTGYVPPQTSRHCSAGEGKPFIFYLPSNPPTYDPWPSLFLLRLQLLTFDRDGAVIFVGMDTPELPWTEVLAARHAAEKDGKAYICPGALAKTKFSYLIRTAGVFRCLCIKNQYRMVAGQSRHSFKRGANTNISEV